MKEKLTFIIPKRNSSSSHFCVAVLMRLHSRSDPMDTTFHGVTDSRQTSQLGRQCKKIRFRKKIGINVFVLSDFACKNDVSSSRELRIFPVSIVLGKEDIFFSLPYFLLFS